MRRKTGLIVGHGRWKKELYEGDTIEVVKGGPILKGKRFVIKYQNEWACFMADEKDKENGFLLHLAKDERWSDGTQLLISKVKIIKQK